ncbi:MAG: hypothetical protein P8Q24_11190 [Glaciecola sp.]|nr:hypothetical protein [Glaciecola sp.]MDG1469708.1 hypothetical protein [Glaciecola sp.]
MSTEIVQWAQQASLPVIGQWQSKPAFLLEMSHSHIPAAIHYSVCQLAVIGLLTMQEPSRCK